jgi:repressor LexA
MKKLTRRQQEVLDFIKKFIQDHNFPPTIREVAEKFKISVKGSYDHIKALEKKAYIKCNLNRSRAIELLRKEKIRAKSTAKVPILGSVAAGQPLFTEENFEGDVDIAVDMIGGGKHFAVKVKGDSMKEAGILDGDLAVINYQETAENGEIVVAMVEEAVTLKRFYIEKNRIKLKAENRDFPPIYTQNARILGKLACIIRKYN